MIRFSDFVRSGAQPIVGIGVVVYPLGDVTPPGPAK